MKFIVLITLLVAFFSIVFGGVEKFELNGVKLNRKQKWLFPIITINLIFLHFKLFISNYSERRELSIRHLKFMSIQLPIAYRCLLEIVAHEKIEINSTNWINIYKTFINHIFLSKIEKESEAN